MTKYHVITWRAPGGELYFFRGDDRHEIFLPYISTVHISKGWVRDERYARVFDTFPIFDEQSFAKNFIADRMKVYEYKKEVLPTQILRPTTRPRRGRYPR